MISSRPTVVPPNVPPAAAGDRVPARLTSAGAAAPLTTTRAAEVRGGVPARVMIVDDEPINIKVARKYLQIAGYRDFVTVTEAPRALDAIRSERPDVVLLDVMMPEVSGLEILKAIRDDEHLRHLPVLILTASTDAGTKLQALELGATDFLAKPVDPNELIPRIRNALVVKAHHDHLAGYSERLEAEVRLRTAELEESRLHVILCLARAAEYRDDATGRHVIRVGRVAGVIAREMGLGEEFAAMLELAAQLHDVGKIGVPDSILLKPGKLTAEEYDLMKRHCGFGREIIAPALAGTGGTNRGPQSPILLMAANLAGTHHERWDGTGYPRGLAGAAIPIEGRITAVADVYDALSSKRPYKEAFPLDRCLSIIREGSGTQFDPDVVNAFLRRVDEIVTPAGETEDRS